MADHPIQPLETDSSGTLRFKENKIVRHLLDHGGINLNDIAILNFPQEDQEQFAQLIGYSLSGFSELSYVSDETYETASKMADGEGDERDCRIAHLRETLDVVRRTILTIVPALFRVHPEDLQT